MLDLTTFLTREFRDPGGVVAFLRAYRATEIPSEEAVKKWFQRGSVKGEWLALLLALLEIERGAPVSLAPYLLRPK